MNQTQVRGEPSPRLDAEEAYYDSLFDQVERALSGDAPIPQVPEPSELEFTDGYLICNGRPVWPSDSASQSRFRAVMSGFRESRPDAARLKIIDDRVETLVRITRERLLMRGTSPEKIARFDAEQSFYRSLGQQVQRARRGEAPIPEIPDPSELQFVDGWLVWEGRPVWWSGYRPDGGSSPVSSTSVDTPSNAAHPPARERPKLRRLLTLPWRRAAA